jgi:pilus assembly protein FimV
MALASCLALSGIPLQAHAAGLGKVVVFSGLGQPLRAEIEVTATRDELSDMKAKLASKEAFQQAGLDFAPSLLSIRFSIDKRASGTSVIKLVSSAPINDPFIDMLLELNWPTGRLVREYTFLLDPPEVAARNAALLAPVVVSKPETQAAPSAAAVAAARRSAAPAVVEPREKSVPKARVQEAPEKPAEQAKPAEQVTEEKSVRQVKRGDTLHRIASSTKPEGVSLEQMLVGLFRANQDAFDGANMNRLRAGKILVVPEQSALESITPAEAKKVVVAQSADWNAYRSKLASVAAQTPVKEAGGKQEVAGKITAKVEEKLSTSDAAKDQLKVSATEMANAKAGAAAKRSEEELVAKEKALKEANDRLASLEKNVVNLQKLLDMKSQNLADLQQRATEKTAPAELKKPEEAARPPVSASPAPTPAVVPASEKPAEVKAPEPVVEPAKLEEAKIEAKPAEAPPPPVAEPKPAEAQKPKPRPVPPPPPPEEPSFVEELLDNPMPLIGGGGILALLAAYFVARRRRSGKGEIPLDLSSTLSSTEQSLTANSVFRSTGGQSVDTSSHTPAQTDFSQAGPGSIDTDEVDPVAEADVYMAYGRDAQAEEILLEAKQKDPNRYAIHLKLLEIYANRKDLKQFESLATDIYGETGGVGGDWEKAAAMGLKLEPTNPLYGGAASADAFDADATVVVSPSSMRSTVTLPGALSQLAGEASEAGAVRAPEPAPAPAPAPVRQAPAVESDLHSLDFDLGLESSTPDAPDADEDTKTDLTFDLGMNEAPEMPRAEEATRPLAAIDPDPDETLRMPEPLALDKEPLDFDLAMPGMEATRIAPLSVNKPEADLDFNLLEDSSPEAPVASAADIKKAMADLDFDLGAEPAAAKAEDQTPGYSAQAETRIVPDASSNDDDGVEFDVKLTESTFLGAATAEPVFDMSALDLDLKTPEIQLGSTPEAVASTALAPEQKAADAADLEFEAVQVSTVVNGDFSAVQAETIVSPNFGLAPEEDMAPEFEISANEEVTTKLDLAKAYQEMGDLEGARELLQEVLKEGNATQRASAQTILDKVGA